jgi:hypothetical protein
VAAAVATDSHRTFRQATKRHHLPGKDISGGDGQLLRQAIEPDIKRLANKFFASMELSGPVSTKEMKRVQ